MTKTILFLICDIANLILDYELFSTNRCVKHREKVFMLVLSNELSKSMYVGIQRYIDFNDNLY